ncbi:hypothetical protein BC936DRAFT_138652 [Jimgerdemannia flammicorona]|uniref:GH16 domain-containing protein n=1 Tax=Jimgerdemannia flammicorona TaxID=994334 RepID=A0A433DI76_9FUNG|nr:hypothetical protein BC936DRAFT_138652 [Jimgerdemannia flammicorona]
MGTFRVIFGCTNCFELPLGTFADAFHTFGIEWTPTASPPMSTTQLWSAWISLKATFGLRAKLAARHGTGGYFSDSAPGKPCNQNSAHAVNDFWAAKNIWYPTWGSGKNLQAAMAIDWMGDDNCGGVVTSSSRPAPLLNHPRPPAQLARPAAALQKFLDYHFGDLDDESHSQRPATASTSTLHSTHARTILSSVRLARRAAERALAMTPTTTFAAVEL